MLLALRGGGWGSNFQENSVTYHLNSPIEHDDTFYNHKFQFYYKVIMMCIWLRPTKSGPVGLKKLTFHTFHHVQYNGCFKHMNYRLSMSNKPCHTIFFSFRMVGLQSWVLRVTKASRFLRYPQDTSHFLCFYHVQINTYNLLYCMIPIVDDHG